VSGLVKHEMENARELNVPLAVDVGVGANWRDAK
jgi:DNA polymerase I-like protein with 3'-5' exonuclease and polymerase domains